MVENVDGGEDVKTTVEKYILTDKCIRQKDTNRNSRGNSKKNIIEP